MSDHSAHLHLAISGAADKLKRALDSALGRLHDKQLHKTPTLVDETTDEEVNE